MAVDTLTIVPATSSGIAQFNRALSVGTCSPTTTSSVGNAPLVDLLFDYFGFTIFAVSGHFDNSSITSFSLTPSGGSTITMNVNSYSYNSSSNYTQWASSDSSGNLVSGTTYTLRLFSGSTNVNTERVTLERRTPTEFSDFYGATRNVPPVSGEFKLSWLKNAEKYSHGATMTAGKQVYGPPVSQTIRGYHVAITGSMNNTTISDIINFWNNRTIIAVMETSDTTFTITLIMQTDTSGNTPGVNSQWYKLKIGSTSLYREDATFSYNSGSFPYWTSFDWDMGTTQTIYENNNYAVELIC